MAVVRLPAYLYELREQSLLLDRVYEKAAALDAAGALDPAYALYYYSLRNATFAATVAVVKAFRNVVAEGNEALAASIPEPTIGRDLPRTASTLPTPERSAIAPVSLGLGNPAIAVSAEAVVATILGVTALAAIASVIYVSATTVTQLVNTYRLTRAYEKLLEERQKYVTRCMATGKTAEECARLSQSTLPTPDEAIADTLSEANKANVPWYLSPWFLLGAAAVLGGGYIYREYKTRLRPSAQALGSATSAGSLRLPRQLNSMERSTSTYGLEV